MPATAIAPAHSPEWEKQIAAFLSLFSSSPGEHSDEEVVFSTDFAGARYTLLRESLRTLVSFSPREREIIDMVASGYSNKIIADILDISSFTVATYLRRVFAKLNVSTRAVMVAAAAPRGHIMPGTTRGRSGR